MTRNPIFVMMVIHRKSEKEMKTWESTIKINGYCMKVRVNAETWFAARDLLEAMYGKENVWTAPVSI